MTHTGDEDQQVCALPGCNEPVAQLPGGPMRLYCSRQHRVAARKQRYEARMAVGDEDGTPRQRSRSTPTGAKRMPRVATLRSQQLRRGLAGSLGARARQAFAFLARETEPERWTLRSRRGIGVTVIVAALVAVLVSGDVARRLSSNGDEGPETPPQSSATASGDWATEANGTLKAINRQLRLVRRAERTAAAVPANQRTDQIRRLNRRLNANKEQLRRQRASLRADLAAVEMYEKTSEDLESIREERRLVDQALQPLRELAGEAREQVAGELRGLRQRARRLDQQEKVLVSAEENQKRSAETARGKQVPSPPANTRQLVNRVLDIATPLAGEPKPSSPPEKKKHDKGKPEAPKGPKAPPAAKAPPAPKPSPPGKYGKQAPPPKKERSTPPGHGKPIVHPCLPDKFLKELPHEWKKWIKKWQAHHGKHGKFGKFQHGKHDFTCPWPTPDKPQEKDKGKEKHKEKPKPDKPRGEHSWCEWIEHIKEKLCHPGKQSPCDCWDRSKEKERPCESPRHKTLPKDESSDHHHDKKAEPDHGWSDSESPDWTEAVPDKDYDETHKPDGDHGDRSHDDDWSHDDHDEDWSHDDDWSDQDEDRSEDHDGWSLHDEDRSYA